MRYLLFCFTPKQNARFWFERAELTATIMLVIIAIALVWYYLLKPYHPLKERTRLLTTFWLTPLLVSAVGAGITWWGVPDQFRQVSITINLAVCAFICVIVWEWLAFVLFSYAPLPKVALKRWFARRSLGLGLMWRSK